MKLYKDLYDPKLGFHWVWITPLVLILLAYSDLSAYLFRRKQKALVAYYAMKHKDIREAKKLAGIK